jgi:hypothetical protein
MSRAEPWYRWRPTPVGAIAGVLVALGFTLALTDVSWWALSLVALGTFGPGMVRELGWLRDKDEFQRRASHRAAYHAFLVTGFVAFLAIAYTRSGDRNLRGPEDLSILYLALLWFTWMFSSLSNYWGPRKTAFRILIMFGCVWGVFNIASHITQPITLIMELLITTAPFFVLAYGSRRWPRVAGVLLIAGAAGFVWVYFRGFPWLTLVTKAIVVVLFVGPLLTSGLALLGRVESEPAMEGR